MSEPAFEQEGHDIKPGWIVLVVVVLFIFLTLLSATAAGYLALLRRGEARPQTVVAEPKPEPEVSNVRAELFRRPAAGELLRHEQSQALRRYRWVDKQRGVAQIPIDVAMDVVAGGAR